MLVLMRPLMTAVAMLPPPMKATLQDWRVGIMTIDAHELGKYFSWWVQGII
jgi:hypothetical protein